MEEQDLAIFHTPDPLAQAAGHRSVVPDRNHSCMALGRVRPLVEEVGMLLVLVAVSTRIGRTDE
jgi:hypothetical protein